MKNPSSFYGMSYIQGMMSLNHPELTRWEDNGLFYTSAVAADAILKRIGGTSALDVGCGRGFIVRHLRNLGWRADGLEYGSAALSHSLCDARFCDLTERLPVPDQSYDLVLCHGVLSHIHESKVDHAIAELKRVARLAIWTNILACWAETQRHHLTFRPEEWWRPKLAAGGWAEEGTDGHGVREIQYSALWRRV